jgi:hypothetical protein
MSVILRRSAVKIDEPFKKLDVSLTPRDPESQEAQPDVHIHVFYKYSPTKLRFWANPSFFHLIFAMVDVVGLRLYLQNSFYRKPITLYIVHNEKHAFQHEESIFTFSFLSMFILIAAHLAVAVVPFVFRYHQATQVREVSLLRHLLTGFFDALCVFAANAYFGLHDFGTLTTCAFAAFSVSSLCLICEHMSYYSCVLVTKNERALPIVELALPAFLMICALLFAWTGPVARATAIARENPIDTAYVHVFELFGLVLLRNFFFLLQYANMLTYKMLDYTSWLLLCMQLISFALL